MINLSGATVFLTWRVKYVDSPIIENNEDSDVIRHGFGSA